MDSGILIVRLILGLALAAHGAQKLFGWFGGYGLKGTGGFFESLGFRPGGLFALAAGLGEFGGGLLTALGLLSPIGPALIILVMVVAMFSVHVKNGFFASSNGVELNMMNIAGSLALVFAGPGIYSLDYVIGFSRFANPGAEWIFVAIAVALALLNVIARRPASAAKAA